MNDAVNWLFAVKRKLSCRRGETLIESLFSIVIVSLSIVVFTLAVVTASHADAAASDKTELLDENYASAVEQSESSETTRITVEYIDGNASYTVDVFGDGSMNSYKLRE